MRIRKAALCQNLPFPFPSWLLPLCVYMNEKGSRPSERPSKSLPHFSWSATRAPAHVGLKHSRKKGPLRVRDGLQLLQSYSVHPASW